MSDATRVPEPGTPLSWHSGGVGFPDDPEKQTEWLYGSPPSGGASGPYITRIVDPKSSQDMAYIVTAANAFPGLVSALGELSDAVMAWRTSGQPDLSRLANASDSAVAALAAARDPNADGR